MTTILFAKYKTGWKFIVDNSGFAICKRCIILGLFSVRRRQVYVLVIHPIDIWRTTTRERHTSILVEDVKNSWSALLNVAYCFFVLYCCCCEEESTLWTNGRMCLFKLKMLCNILALEWYRMSFFWRCTQSCTLIRNAILAFSLREIFLRLPNLVWQMGPS